MDGLLWYDPEDWATAIGRAADRYREKYGRWPNVCEVNPWTLYPAMEGTVLVGPESEHVVRVCTSPSTLKQHYLIGERHNTTHDTDTDV